MRKIFKYDLLPVPYQRIKLPKGSTILDIQNQKNQYVLWAMVNPEESLEERLVYMFFTGEEIDHYFIKELKYLKTIQEGHLVIHFFVEESQ